MRGIRRHNRRRGAVVVLAVILMTVMFAFLAFTIDLGYLSVARTELQRAADAAAIAATWDLLDEDVLSEEISPAEVIATARARAAHYANANTITGSGSALAESDVTAGYMADPRDRSGAIDTLSLYPPNAIEVRIRRTATQNGEIPFFFARMMGFTSQAAEAKATAAFLTAFKGFQASTDGRNCNLLPFALDIDTWRDLCNNVGDDKWAWDSETKTITEGSDTLVEVNLYPQGTGSPGNRGTVDIGSPNNSTADLARQILYGISPEDLAYHGGKIELNDQHRCYLNGDTGISAGLKDELKYIRDSGEPRIIPVFESVTGNGNNATYTIVRFGGVRIMEVKLTGSMIDKRVMIQKARVKAIGGIPGSSPTSDFLHSPVWLVR